MKTSIRMYAAIGIGGMIGATLRYLLSLLFTTSQLTHFPWATFLTNISGAFLLTFLLFLPGVAKRIQPIFFTSLTTGVIGSYTTFSTIQLEAVLLLQHNRIIALSYICSTIILGLFFSYLGWRVATRFHKKGAKH